MKLVLQNRGVPSCYLHGGLLALAVNLLLASISLAQNTDTRIAFMSTRSGDGEIYLMNPVGKRVRRLTKHPEYDNAPTWSPDGQKITFMSFRDLHRPGGIILAELYVMNADGTNPINLTQSPEKPDGVSSWSPDGKQVAFTSAEPIKWDNGFRWNIFIMEADGGNPRNLTNHHAEDRSPDWSPDGMQIAFSSNRNRDWEFEIEVRNWEVYVMNADGANPINLTNHPAWDSSPSWGFVQPLSVTSKGRLATLWGKVKRSNTYGVK